jgi:hypothetical protein
MRRMGHAAHIGDRRHAYRTVVGITEGRRTLGRPTPIYKDNIKIYFQEVGWGAWTGLIWLRTGSGDRLL